MILGLLLAATWTVWILYACLIAASRYDDNMGYDDVREDKYDRRK